MSRAKLVAMKFERMIISFFDKAQTEKFNAVLIVFLCIFSNFSTDLFIIRNAALHY